MANRAEIEMLLERVRAATGPNREMDAVIARVGGLSEVHLDWDTEMSGKYWYFGCPGDWEHVPDYTSSIDAIIELVSSEFPERIIRLSNEYQGYWVATVGFQTSPQARTAPLALCAAFLSALLASEPST